MKVYSLVLLILFGWSLKGCKNPTRKSPVSVNEVLSSIDTLILSNEELVVHLGKKGLPKMVYPLDEKQNRNGTAVEFKENGGLLSISHWNGGLQEGNAVVFGEQQNTHQLFNQGRLFYEADYQEQQKIDNRLYPTVVEEFFFEDKYYAKIRFPLPYAGQLDIYVHGYQAVISPLPGQTFQLVINDALDLAEYNLELVYQPAPQDTLLVTKYPYKHVVYGE